MSTPADPVRRRGKSRRSLALIETCHEILSLIQPAGVRAVAYQLFIRRLIASMATKETSRVSRLLTEARESREVPWAWIVDETREVECRPSWKTPAAFVESVQHSYRRDHWALQPRRVECWSEKGTVRGTLRPVLDQFGVPFGVLHGFASSTAVYEAVRDCLAGGTDVEVLYCGDWDLSGLYMSEEDLPTRVHRYRAAQLLDRGEPAGPAPTLSLRRIALTAEDVADPALPSFSVEAKRDDKRYPWYVPRFGDRCWELDALDPRVLRERVRAAIVAAIHLPTWTRSIAAEQAEADSLRSVLDRWTGAA